MLSNKSLLTFNHGEYIWEFYRNEQGDLCNRRHISSVQSEKEGELLVKNFKEEYSIALDDEERIHLVAEDSEGKLNYLYWDGSGWSEITRLDPYNQYKVSYLMLAASQGFVYLLYLSKGEDEDSDLRIHQYFDGQKWSEACLLKTVGKSCGKALIQVDADGKHHLINQEINNDKYKLKHYVFDPHKNKWQNYQYHLDASATSTSGGFDPCMIIDRNNTLHLVWLSSDGTNFRVKYRRHLNIGRSVGGWTNTITISLPEANAYAPILIIIENDLLALWQQIDGVYISISKDWGGSWSEPEKEGQLQDFMKLNYIMSEKFNQGRVDLPCTFSSTSPQLMVLAAYLHATKSVSFAQLPISQGKKQDRNTDLLAVRELNSLPAERIQSAKSDNPLYSLTFSMEDNRLTSQQIAGTVKKQQEELDQTNSRLGHVSQHASRLERQIEYGNELVHNMQQEIEQIRSENAKINKELNKEINKMKQQFEELKRELEETKKQLLGLEQRFEELTTYEVIPGYFRKKVEEQL